MTDNINKDKNQQNDVIEYEPNLDSTFSLCSGNKETIPVVTVSLRGGKKKRATIISGQTCLWDSGATNRMIKRRHTSCARKV